MNANLIKHLATFIACNTTLNYYTQAPEVVGSRARERFQLHLLAGRGENCYDFISISAIVDSAYLSNSISMFLSIFYCLEGILHRISISAHTLLKLENAQGSF